MSENEAIVILLVVSNTIIAFLLCVMIGMIYSLKMDVQRLRKATTERVDRSPTIVFNQQPQPTPASQCCRCTTPTTATNNGNFFAFPSIPTISTTPQLATRSNSFIQKRGRRFSHRLHKSGRKRELLVQNAARYGC